MCVCEQTSIIYLFVCIVHSVIRLIRLELGLGDVTIFDRVHLVYLHKTLTVCVDTTFSVSCIFSPWQITTNDRLFGSIRAVMLDVVTQPPERKGKRNHITD